MRRSVSIGSVLLAALIAGRAPAQVLHTLASPNEEDAGLFGCSVSGAGDVGNDGYADVIVGAYQEDPGTSPEDAGRAYIFSGETGALLYLLASPNEEEFGEFGCSVSGAGDVNNDGYADVTVGAHGEGSSQENAGRAYIFSGETGALLYSLVSPNEEEFGEFGCSVSGAGDVNGDGYADVVVGASGEACPGVPAPVPGAGQAYVFNGATGALLHTLISPSKRFDGRFGYAVSGAGDANSDGYADVVVGAIRENPGASPNEAGRAHIFSGATGTRLYTLVSPNEDEEGHFGCSVSGAGDVNNDGYADVIVGACEEGAQLSGRAYVFSGATGTLLHSLVSPNEEYWGFFGASVSGVGDVNEDDHADVIVGAYWEGPYPSPAAAGRAYIFSGATGALLYTLVSPNEEDNGDFGISVSGAGDVNNDGYPDVAVGAYGEGPGSSPENAGRAYVFAPLGISVELACFRAEVEASGVRLVWVTLAEEDNLGFNVLRAAVEDGHYERVNNHLVRGVGTTARREYQYLDAGVAHGTRYFYKLEQLDIDGAATYYGPLEVAVLAQAQLMLEVTPNPSPGALEIALSVPGTGTVEVQLTDLRGRRMARLCRCPMGRGMHVLRWRAEGGVAPGLYVVEARFGELRSAKRWVLLP